MHIQLLVIAASFALGTEASAAPVEAPSPTTYDPSRSFAPLIEAVSPAVVTLEVTGSQDVPPFVRQLFGMNDDAVPRPTGEGSGFIISADGLMLTNHHVISTAEEITVRLHDGEEAIARVVGSDRSMDVALLQLQGQRDWPHVELAANAELKVGDWVVAVGNGLGLGTTVTAGIVSGKGRVLGHDIYGNESFIQTDAAINQGNSGGPLFDLDGHVVGMNTAIIQGANTVGFSIPVTLIEAVLGDLQSMGRVSRGYLGVQPQGLTPELRTALGVDAEAGAVVANVYDDTPASQSGLKNGDVVVSVDGDPIDDEVDLIAAIGNKRPGDRVRLGIHRGEKRQELKVLLAERPREESPSTPDDPADPVDEGVLAALGMTLTSLPASVAADAGVDSGVLVQAVERGSTAAKRLQPGDIIVEVNQRNVRTADDVDKILRRSTGNAFLLVVRDDTQLFVPLTLP